MKEHSEAKCLFGLGSNETTRPTVIHCAEAKLLLSTTVGNARYQLSERFKSVETPKYYN